MTCETFVNVFHHWKSQIQHVTSKTDFILGISAFTVLSNVGVIAKFYFQDSVRIFLNSSPAIATIFTIILCCFIEIEKTTKNCCIVIAMESIVVAFSDFVWVGLIIDDDTPFKEDALLILNILKASADFVLVVSIAFAKFVTGWLLSYSVWKENVETLDELSETFVNVFHHWKSQIQH
ncbi:6959_t:CDS:2, partial [Gigaspora rosea]